MGHPNESRRFSAAIGRPAQSLPDALGQKSQNQVCSEASRPRKPAWWALEKRRASVGPRSKHGPATKQTPLHVHCATAAHHPPKPS
eukprot:76282-Chlamydomonas_euryale.AAC.4